MQTILTHLNNFEHIEYFEDFTYNLDIHLPHNFTFQLHITQNLEILTQLDFELYTTHYNQFSIFCNQTSQFI
jgi:hypothetical protein